MNHIYKSIFNKALGVFTAVPEFASAHGKGSERTVVGRVAKGTAGFAASALAISVGLALTSTSAVAGPGIYINDGTDTGCLAVPDAQGPNVGIHGISGGVPSAALSLLGPSQVVPDRSYYGLDVMKPCLSSTAANATEERSTQTNRTLFYGKNGPTSVNDNGAKNLTLGGRLDVNSGIIGVGDRGVNGGSGATNSIRMGTGTTLADANKVVNGIAIGVNTQATQNLATAIGANAVASGNSASQALGYDAVASGKSAIAHGFHSHADGQSSIAIGDNAKASGIATVSLGFMANGHSEDGDKDNTPSSTKATYGTAVGHFAGADYVGTDNARSTALGNQAGRYGEGGAINTAVGNQAGQYVKGSQNVAMGHLAGSGDATNKLEASNTVSIGSFAKASANNAAAMGTTAQARTEKSLALGQNATAGDTAAPTVKKGEYSTAIGSDTTALGYGATAVGSITKAKVNYATALGHEAEASGSGETSLGYGAGANSTSPNGNRNGVNLGTNAGRYAISGGNNVALGISAGQYVEGDNNIAQGYSAGYYIKGNENVSIGTNANVGSATEKLEVSKTVAIGSAAKTSGNDAIALGNTANSKTEGAISIGAHTVSGDGDLVPGVTNIGNKSISIGYESVANRSDTIAMGVQASTQAADSGVAPWDAVAIGSKAKATTYKALAIGAYSQATGRQSTVIGNDIQGQNSTASGTRSQILGVQSNVSGDNSVSIGDTNTIASARTYAIGNNINVAAGANDSLAFGTRAHVSGANQVSIGKDAGADAAVPNTSGIVIGESAGRYLEGGTRNTAIGERAGQYVKGSYNIAMGTNAGSRTATDTLVVDDSTSIGHNAKAVTSESIAIGKNAESGKVDKFDGKKATAIGHEAKALGTGNIAMGAYATSENGHDGVAIGTYVKSSNVKAIAIGAYSSASGVQSIAIANNYNSDNSYASNKSTATGVRAIVMGAESHATAERALAIGDKNTVASARTYAIGNNINVAAGADDSLVFGTRAAVGAENTVAIGANANAAQANSVALGAGSATSDVNTGDYTLTTSYTAAGQPVAANGTVSVGSAGKERQIQNVAAGVISATSTDAINGSQLYATNNYMNNFAGDVKTKLGGNAALGNDGHLTMTNIGGTGENTVDDAIKNLKTAIDNKADTTASVTSENQADIKVDKEAPVGNTTNYKLSLGGDAKAKLAKAATALQTVEGDSNITATKDATDPTKVKLALNKNLTADSVTLGDKAGDHAVVNKDGLTIANGPSVKKDGINAGNKKITGVANGNVATGSTDAVNGGQLAEVKSKADSAVQNVVSSNPTALTANKVGNTVTLTPNFIAGDLVNADGTVNAPATADEGKLVSAKTVADALKANHFVVDTQANGGTVDSTSEKNAKVGSGNKVTFEAGNNLVAKQANTANGGATVKFSLKDDISLNSVTAGTGANQVVLGNDGVKVGGNTYINNDGLNANSKVISNVADGVKPTDAVNKGQLDAVKGVADSAVKSVDVAANEDNLVVDNNDPKNPKLRLRKAVDLDSIKLENNVGEKSFLNSAGLTIEGGPAVTRSGINANNTKVTNVTDGDVNSTSKDAVNGSQLYNVADNVKDLIGPDAKIDPATGKVTVADPAKGIGETGKDNIGDAIKAVNKAATAAKTTVKEGDNITVTPTTNTDGSTTYTVATKKDLDVTSVTAGNTTVNTNGLTITGGPSVTRGGIDAGNAVITNVRDGKVEANSKDAVNGGQLHATNTKLDGVKAKADTAVQDVKSGDENALTAVKDPNTNIVTVTPKLSGNLVDADGNITAPTTPADKGKLVTAGTVADALANTHFVVDTKATDGELDAASQADQKIKAGNKVTLQAGKNLKAKQTNGANGAQVEFSLKDSISLKEVTAGEGANQVVLGNDGVKVGGNTYINNAGLNANGNKITNVADGVDPTDAVNKSQLDAVKGVADSAVKSVDVANGEQNLVVDNSDPKNPKLSLKKDLTVDSVKAGDSTLNNDGLTIAGGPSVKKDGINAGDKTITNVAPGAVTPTSKDAVNGGQLYNVANNVKDLIGPDATIDPATGKVTVADPAKGIGETGKGNIGDAIKHVNDAAKAAADTAKKHTTVEQGDNIVVEESLNADGGKHYKVSTAKDLNVDSVKAGDTTVNNDGVTIAGGPSVTKAGINAGGNTITNVADGVNPNDAVNKGQLDAVKGVADSAVKSVDVANGEQNLVVDNSDPKNPKLSLKKDLTVDSVKAGDSTLNNDGLTIAGGPSVKKDGINAGDKTITNVAPGAVTPTSKDAVNGGQLYNVANNVKDLIGPDATIDPATGKVTVADPAKGIGETGKGNIGDAIKYVNDAAKAAADTAKKHTTVEQGDNIVVEESTNADGGKHYKVSTAKNLNVDSVKAGDTTVNNDGVTINNGPSMTKDGINANNTKVTNVADGVDVADAVNKGQLDKVDTKVSNVAQNVVNVLGGDAAVNGNGDITMSNIGETGKGNINDAIKSVNDLAKKAAAEKTSVKAKEGRSNVTVTEGVNAAGGHEYTVDVERSVTNAGSDYVTVTNNHDADTNTTTYTVDVSAKTKASLAKADSAVQGLTSKDGNLNFTKGANGNVEVSFNDNLNVKNVTTDRVQVANGPSMSKDGINAAGKAISNVANGNVAADSKDAVNGGQLHETAKSVADVIGGGATVKDGKVVAGQNGIGNTGQNTVHGAIAAINQNTANNFNQIRGDLRKMDRDLRGGIAGALATAGLPQAFRPGKSMVAAAASTYRGQSGLAIGVSRISDNGKVILKVTGNTNSRGDFGGTIGAGYQW